jgi:superfamily II DNA helicase RecQ
LAIASSAGSSTSSASASSEASSEIAARGEAREQARKRGEQGDLLHLNGASRLSFVHSNLADRRCQENGKTVALAVCRERLICHSKRMNPEANCVVEAEQALRRVFGFEHFRGVQADVVERVLAGLSTLAVMPTGAGKSLTYQLPATMLPGTCVVISPLIALMHDQLRAARANGIRAATLTSVDEDRAATVQAFRNGELDLLYVAPERASQPHFRELLSNAPLCLFAIDEAHCVSEWGHDFRPDYRQLRPLMDAFADVPRLALTATADERTRADILEQLGIPRDGLVIAGFDRPNIRYAIRHRDKRGSAACRP